MDTKLLYNFQEKNLGLDFAREKLTDFKKLIGGSQSFSVVSMPGVGVSYFLKYLSCQDFAHFVHIDLYNLPSLSQHEFYRMFHRDLGGKPTTKSDEQIFLETKDMLKKLSEKHEKIVIIFSRFDQLKNDLDENFLSNLQALTTIVPGSPRFAGEAGKIVLIFTAIKPLYELAPEAITGGNLPFYSRIYYFKPFADKDLKKLFLLEHTQKAHPDLDKIIKLCGGHIQLLNVFNNSHKQNNLLLDKFVTLQLKDLVNYLDYQQKKDVQKIALGKEINEPDEYLLGVGYIQTVNSKLSTVNYRIFSPVLEEYIKQNIPHKLPVKEKALFNLLRKNTGQVVTKDEIFNSIWGENPPAGGATDWALDALVYRLRKHPFIKSQGYIIESLKKVGYTLIQG